MGDGCFARCQGCFAVSDGNFRKQGRFVKEIAFVFVDGDGWAIDTAAKVWFGPFNEDPYSSQIFFNKALGPALGLGEPTPDMEKAGKVYLSESRFRKLVVDKKRKEEEAEERTLQQRDFLNRPFPEYARNYVEGKMNVWQKKGEFEKLEDYRRRVTESARQKQAGIFLKQAEDSYMAERGRNYPLSFSLSDYDSENEVFLVEEKDFGKLLVPVPIKEARAFKENWEMMEINPSFRIRDDRLALSAVDFKLPSGNVYRYDNTAEVKYVMADIAYCFDPISFDADSLYVSAPQRQAIGHTRISVGKSDVDVNIPQTGRVDSSAFAVIIANENYARLSAVPYALNDGTVFGEYCKKTLGIPKEHIRFYGDATYGTMLMAIRDIQDIADAYEGKIDVFFYYAGHGSPKENAKDAYLLPVDSYGTDSDASYPLSRLYRELGELPAFSVTVFLDACFSGATREGPMLASARSVSIKPQINAPSGNTVVFSAASGDETALPFKEKKHGLFTYYLLKKLQETRGKVSYEELGNYVLDQVRKRSVVLNRKSQSPNMTASPSLSPGWEKRKL